MPSPRALRLVLPHQLFDRHLAAADGTTFVLIEHDLLFRQYAFHAQKLVLHRASMARFARRLRGRGHEVVTLRSDAEASSHDQLADLVRRLGPREVTFFDVVDDWLEQDLVGALEDGGYRLRQQDLLETPNFLTTRGQVDDWFAANTARMHEFYVWQRRRLGLLLDADGRPVGGKWSFDADNRKKLPRGYTPPDVSRVGDRTRDVAAAVAWVADEFPDNPGDPHLFAWPTDADEAREHLREFVRERLADFGPYEDAISAEHPFVDHSLLTAALNVGLLDPEEVVRAVLEDAPEETPLASVEGFVRQVIGWREYMRATYRVRGRQLRTANRLGHDRALGDGWWDASTGLAPVDLVVSRVLATGYAHHIERLMVLGNAMCLLRVDPDEVYEWFMEMFIDAYDWVMVPNVYAMSQFAAGEEITTKPYVSGSNYLRTMSDLTKGEWATEWDGLYWTFVEDHREVFEGNPRSRMMVSLLDKMDPDTRRGHRAHATALLEGGADGRLLRPRPPG